MTKDDRELDTKPMVEKTFPNPLRKRRERELDPRCGGIVVVVVVDKRSADGTLFWMESIEVLVLLVALIPLWFMSSSLLLLVGGVVVVVVDFVMLVVVECDDDEEDAAKRIGLEWINGRRQGTVTLE